MRKFETIVVPIKRDYAEVYELLSEPRHYPNFSPIPNPLFAPAGNNGLDWFVDLPRGRRILRFAPRNGFGVLDYTVLTEAGNLEYMVPLRLVADEEGCVLMALHFERSDSEEQFRSDVEWITNDMRAIALVAETLRL